MKITAELSTALAGRYAVEREIGRGGMAVVYLARDTKHDRLVAVKVLNPELGAMLGAERFLSEIKTTATLQHPNLLPLFDSGEANGLLYYVMPYRDGESLRARLVREQQLPVDDAVRIATGIANALSYAHARGVIHRDLKPENVLLQHGQPVVLDFGVALAVRNAAEGRKTQTGISVGTPQYMSPEQAAGEKVIDSRADIYALGALTYEMLAGDPPHTGPSAQVIMSRVMAGDIRPVTVARPSVPAYVANAVHRALARVPADRFSTAVEFAQALAPQNATTIRAPIERPPSHRPNARELVAWALAAVGLATTAWYATRTTPAPTAGRFTIGLPDSVAFAPFTNSTRRLAISRDGTRLVFVGRSAYGTQTALYSRRANDGVAQPLRGTDGARSPSFSPTGEWIAYSTGSTLLRIPADGGTPQKLAAAAALPDSGAISYSSWGDDGRIVYQAGRHIWIVSASGGDARIVAQPDTIKRIYQLRQPDVLPGGAHALVSFVRGSRTANAAPDSVRLGVISLSDGSLEDLGVQGAEPRFVAPGQVVYNRGSVVFAAPFSLRSRSFTGRATRLVEDVAGVNLVTADFAVADNGWLVYLAGRVPNATTMWVTELTGAARQLRADPRMFGEVAVSPDGKRIATGVRALDASVNIWIYDLASGSLSPLTTDGGSARPVWSRDGSRVYYVNDSERGIRRLMSRAWDGSGRESTHVAHERLGEFEPGPPTGWSAVRTSPPRDILVAPSESLRFMRPLTSTATVNETYPAISPNGRWIAYQSDVSGRDEVLVRPIPGPGAAVPVSIDGGVQPRWSPDGRTLFFRSPAHMMAAAVVESPQLSVTRRDTLFIDTFSRGTGFHFDVFPNGRQFLMLRGGTTQQQLSVVVNWPRLLETRSAVTDR